MAECALLLEGAPQHLPSRAAGCLPAPAMPRARFGPRLRCRAPGGCFSLLCFHLGANIYNKQKKQCCSLGRLPSLPVSPTARARNLPQPTHGSSKNIKAEGIRVGSCFPQALKQLSLALLLSAAPIAPASPLCPVGGGWLGFWGQLFFRWGSELLPSRLTRGFSPSPPSPPQIRTQ